MLLSALLLLPAFFLFSQNTAAFEVKDHVLVKYRGYETIVLIPETLRINRIGEKAFAGSRVIMVKIPVGVEAIDGQAFAGCSFLKTVQLPNTLSSIGCRAFFNCGFLESINIPRSLGRIEEEAFLNCKSLGELELPSSLKSIGARAFTGCFGLAKLSLSRRTKVGERAFMGVPPDSIAYRD